MKCKVYHNVLLDYESQVDFDRLLQLHMSNKTEDNNYISWEYCKVVDNYKEKVHDHCPNRKYLV
jgi:hypothetical protein